MSLYELDGSVVTLEISQENIKDFLLNVKKNFKIGEDLEIEQYNKKYLREVLKDFGIVNIKNNGIHKLYIQIISNITNFKFFKGENLLDFDVTNFENEIKYLKKISDKLEKVHNRVLNSIETKIVKNIKQYGELILQEGNEKEIFKEFKEKEIYDKVSEYVGEISGDDLENKVELKQTTLQIMGSSHILIALVVEINGKKIDIDILKNKKTGEIVKNHITKADFDLVGNKLEGGNKKSGIRNKLYDNPNAGVELNSEHKFDIEKYNLINDENEDLLDENGGIQEDEFGYIKMKVNLSKDIRNTLNSKNGRIEKKEALLKFIQVTKEWNKVFKKNRAELIRETDIKKRKKIISNNAQIIANLFADNASLQGTMDFDNSTGEEGIKAYFEHFLAKSPTMRFKKINEIREVEKDGLLYAQGDYDFEVNDGNGSRTPVDANFAFYLEKNDETGKWGIKRLNSTFGKTEDNLKETIPENKKKQD